MEASVCKGCGADSEAKVIYEQALQQYGVQPQITMVFEEMSELQKELCKYLRGKTTPQHIANIAEEIADVEIMLEQMKLLFDIADEVNEARVSKTQRLKSRLERTDG